MTESMERLREDLDCVDVLAHNIDTVASDSFRNLDKRINRIHKRLDKMDRDHRNDLKAIRAQIAQKKIED